MKKHLSRIVSQHLLATILLSFTALMIITLAFISNYAKYRTDRQIFFALDNVNKAAVDRIDANLEINVPGDADLYDSMIAENGEGYISGPEFRQLLADEVESNADSERNIIDSGGIVVASSDPDNVGYDIKSDPVLSEFICLLEGEDTLFKSDFVTSSMNDTPMRYSAASMPRLGGFFLQGQTSDEFYGRKKQFLSSQVMFDRVGKTGYFMLLDQNNTIISSTDQIHDDEVFILPGDIMELSKNERSVRADVFGTRSYIGICPDKETLLVAVYPALEIWQNWIIAIAILILIYVFVFLILFHVIRRLLSENVVTGVYSLNNSLKRITAGHLDEKADYRESIEFSELSDGINFMVGSLNNLISEAKERIDNELALAAKIQTSFLTHKFPAFPDRDEFELYAAMTPAKEVGGDFYDFFLIDEDHLALVIGDVSGKGIPAAMFMVMAENKLRYSVMKHGINVAEAVREVNTDLIKENGAELFVAVWLGVLTISTGDVEYVNAGHEYPAIYRKKEAFRVDKDAHCHPLAVNEEAEFTAGAFKLGEGDILYLYTDGVCDVFNSEGEKFGRERMLKALDGASGLPVSDIDAKVREAIAEHIQDMPQSDDITTLVMRYSSHQISD